MGRKYQITLEQLRQQQPDLKYYSSTPSPGSSTVPSNKRPKCNVPNVFNLDNLYNPKYTVTELISTRKIFENKRYLHVLQIHFSYLRIAILLELQKLGYRYCMPDICHQSKRLWMNIPSEAKERYDILALQAQILHQEMYPDYKFSPKKRQTFKLRVLPSKKNHCYG